MTCHKPNQTPKQQMFDTCSLGRDGGSPLGVASLDEIRRRGVGPTQGFS